MARAQKMAAPQNPSKMERPSARKKVFFRAFPARRGGGAQKWRRGPGQHKQCKPPKILVKWNGLFFTPLVGPISVGFVWGGIPNITNLNFWPREAPKRKVLEAILNTTPFFLNWWPVSARVCIFGGSESPPTFGGSSPAWHLVPCLA